MIGLFLCVFSLISKLSRAYSYMKRDRESEGGECGYGIHSTLSVFTEFCCAQLCYGGIGQAEIGVSCLGSICTVMATEHS